MSASIGSNKRCRTAPRLTPPIEPNASILRHEDPATSKLNTMTIEEHSRGLHDLHGISDLPDETPETLRAKVNEMNEVLSSPALAATDASAFRQAFRESPEYVERLKIPCLRAVCYNSRQAAALMLRFFRQKLALFGPDKLTRAIQLADLSEEDRDCLNSGARQILPHRDRAGRAILLALGAKNQLYEIETTMRVSFYLAMTAIHRDEEDQKRGVVYVHYGFGQRAMPADRVRPYQQLWHSLPWRVVAGHVCGPPNKGTMLDRGFHTIRALLKPSWLVRTRFHQGSELECIYELMTFGILKEALKVTSNGDFDLTHHREMLKSLEYQEEEQKKSSEKVSDHLRQVDDNSKKNSPIVLGAMDILIGREGHRLTSLRATWLMNQLVREGQKKHNDNASPAVTQSILEKLKGSGCRFLKASPNGGFEECNDAEALAKIAHGLRNDRRSYHSTGGAVRRQREQ